MKLANYKLLFITIGLICILLVASPIVSYFPLPKGDQYTELYLLGSTHALGNYPSNIAVGRNYTVYIGTVNHLQSSTYYAIYVKLGNETDSLPNATLSAASSLPVIFTYKFCISNNEVWERQLPFSIKEGSISDDHAAIKTLTVNGMPYEINKSTIWNSNSSEYCFKLIFELWSFDSQLNEMAYNNCFVQIHLNMTESAL